jgi:Na+-driven multidrug efflux pump
LTYILVFQYGFGIEGIWIAFCFGLMHQVLHYLILLSFTSWESACEEAQKRMAIEKENSPEEVDYQY